MAGKGKSLFLFLFLSLLFASLSLGYPVTDIDDLDDSDDIFDPDDHHGPLVKKWNAVKPGSHGNRLWKDGEVKYKYKKESDQTKLADTLDEAMNTWYCAGLDSDKFKLTLITDDEAKKMDRSDWLEISYVEGSLSTTPGCPTGGEPKSRLGLSTDIGFRDPVANIAHEIGHMFGLLHEHQNPLFWGTAGSGAVFKLNCENLADYSSKTRFKSDNKKKEMCSNYQAAADAKFSAADILPILSGTQSEHALSADENDVDWQSIMLYSSAVGGKGKGSDRAHVLVKADGSEIPTRPNMRPSKKDVEGLVAIYS